MKKLINGKRYNSETAQKIYTITKGNNNETLYKKKTGEFFLYKYNTSKEYEKNIKPLKIDEAKNWLQSNAGNDIYKKEFEENDEERILVSFLLDKKIHEQVKKEANEHGITHREIFNEALKQYFDDKNI